MKWRHWGVAQIHMKISEPACQLLWMEQAWGKLQGYKPLCGLLGALAQDALHRELESWKNYSSLAPQITSEERYSFWWRQRVESTASTDRISIYWRQWLLNSRNKMDYICLKWCLHKFRKRHRQKAERASRSTLAQTLDSGGGGVLSWGVDGKCHSRNSVPVHSLSPYQDLQLRGMDREKQAVRARSVGQYCGSALSTRNVYQQCGPTVWASSSCYRMWMGATQKNSLPTTYQRSKGPSVYVWDL